MENGMKLIKVTKKELKSLKAVDFNEGDIVDVIGNNGEMAYTISISFGQYKRPLKTTVQDKNFKYLSCTAGVRGGWPYFVADFIQAI